MFIDIYILIPILLLFILLIYILRIQYTKLKKLKRVNYNQLMMYENLNADYSYDTNHYRYELSKTNSILGEVIHHIGEICLTKDFEHYLNSDKQFQALSMLGNVFRVEEKRLNEKFLNDVYEFLEIDKFKVHPIELASHLICADWEERIELYKL